MPEPEVTPNPNPAPPTPPAGGGTPPAPPTPPEPGASREEVEKYKKDSQEYSEYRQKVDPILETLWSDQELLKTVTEKHNKRLGIAPQDPPADPNKDKNTPPADPDNRNATINIISNTFEEKVGISKMDDKAKQAARGMVGQILKEMLDPKGNKTITQVFDEVSLTKLPWYLEQAWKLVNRDNELSQAKEQGKNELRAEYEGQTAIIGSMPGGSVPIDEMTLTPKEKEVAAKMGVSEDAYLKNKKELAKMRS